MLFRICCGLMLIISAVTFVLYARDKTRAIQKRWRISEKVLLVFSFLGGAFGGTCGMFFLRHKTKHWYFRVINFLGLLWQFSLLMYLFIAEL